MAFFENCVERATAIAATCGWLALGGGLEAGVGIVIGAAGLAAVFSNAARNHGPESQAALKAIRRRIAADLRASAKAERWDNNLDLHAADAAMDRALTGCFLDRNALAASARSKEGFPKAGTRLIVSKLAEREPHTFGEQGPEVARNYAQLVVKTALKAAIENEAYFKSLQPHLLMETLRGLGTLERDVAAGFAEQSRQRAEDRADLQRILGTLEALKVANLRPNLSASDNQKVDEALRSQDPETRRTAYLSRGILNMARAAHELVLDIRAVSPATDSFQDQGNRLRDERFEGDLLRAKGDLVEAIAAYESALTIDAKDGFATAALANALIDLALRPRADGANWIHDRDAFSEAIDRAGKLVLPFMNDDCGASIEARVAAIWAFSRIWFECAQRGVGGTDAVQQSTDALKKADSLDADNAITLRLLGRNIHLFSTDKVLAEQYFKRAVSTDVAGVDSTFFYALFLSEIRGREADAAQMFESCLILEPDEPNVLEAFAHFLSRVPENATRAEMLWRHSLRLYPNHPVGWLHYGGFLSRKAELAIIAKQDDATELTRTAEDIFKRGLSHRPNDASLWCEYAVLLEHILGREGEAIAAYDKVLAWQPDAVEPYVRSIMHKLLIGLVAEPGSVGEQVTNKGVQQGDQRMVIAGAWLGVLYGDEQSRAGALTLLKSMQGRFGADMQFIVQSRSIRHAIEAGNGYGTWLGKLADVIAGELPQSALNGWAEWVSIEPAEGAT